MLTTEKRGCLGIILSIFQRSERPTATGVWPQDATVEKLPYHVRASLLTHAEISFYHVLASVVSKELVICPKVGLKDALFIPGRHDQNYMKYFGRISQKHIDFVLCDPSSMKPVAAIELDDSSHNRQDRKERDSFMDKVFTDAGLPLLRIDATRTYSTGQLAAVIEPFLLKGNSIQNNASQIVSADHATPPLCPRHQIPMILRTASKGANVGQQFYGCPHYPNCREIINLG